MADNSLIFPRADVLRRPVVLPCPIHELLDELGDDEEPALLDSAAEHPSLGRYSLLACRPLEVLTVRAGKLSARDAKVLAKGPEAIWHTLGRALAPIAAPTATTPPYGPGWIGYVGYEMGRLIEHLPGRACRDTRLPDLRLALYDAILLADAQTGQAEIVELKFDTPAPARAGEAGQRLRQLLERRPETIGYRRPRRDEKRAATAEEPAPRATSNFKPEQYRAAVGRCLDYIGAGDIFQVNLSQRFELPRSPEPRQAYQTLRACNPACYAGYLSFAADDGTRCAILSSSPELFLRVRGRRVLTRPIKGTRRRTGEPVADAAARADLRSSPKDNAELAMIVDLLRNDLGRVCEFGTIKVTDPAAMEEHPTVFHLVATIEGELRPDVGPAELLRATFPGGSITGAPKIRAMEIIDELEPVARGVYTGCVGIVCADGNAEWNIAIRTVVRDGERTLIQAGGGIVADSTPDAEYDETIDKARAMLEAMAPEQNPEQST